MLLTLAPLICCFALVADTSCSYSFCMPWPSTSDRSIVKGERSKFKSHPTFRSYIHVLCVAVPCSPESRMDQAQYDRIFAYLHNGKTPCNLSKNEKDLFRRKCTKFVVKDGFVYFRHKKMNRDLQVCNYFNSIWLYL